MRIYRYIAIYEIDGKDEKKHIDLFNKDIEDAYSKCIRCFGTKNFKEIYFSRVIRSWIK